VGLRWQPNSVLALIAGIWMKKAAGPSNPCLSSYAIDSKAISFAAIAYAAVHTKLE
jgi:hypothetical protein